MDLVFQLPARREPWYGGGKAEQDPGIPFQRAWADIEYLAEKLRSGTIVLISPFGEMADLTRLAVELETWLDCEMAAKRHFPSIDPRLPGPEKLRPA